MTRNASNFTCSHLRVDLKKNFPEEKPPDPCLQKADGEGGIIGLLPVQGGEGNYRGDGATGEGKEREGTVQGLEGSCSKVWG